MYCCCSLSVATIMPNYTILSVRTIPGRHPSPIPLVMSN
jgi:hypothetical protein